MRFVTLCRSDGTRATPALEGKYQQNDSFSYSSYVIYLLLIYYLFIRYYLLYDIIYIDIMIFIHL